MRSADEHPHLEVLLRSGRAYRAGRLDIAGLAANFYAVMSAMEGDVPEPIRRRVYQLEGEFELLRFTDEDQYERRQVEELIGDFERLIGQYYRLD